MRHEHLEHLERPQPFSVSGDLAFILRSFALNENMSADEAESMFSSGFVCTFTLTGKTCSIFKWQCDIMNGKSTYVVDALPIRMVTPAPKSDPWVVVGTTTIDGTFEQVREAFGETWENVDHLSYALARGDQWNIGGRHLVVHSHEVFDGGVLVSFDIVRRQSEIDTEKKAREQAILDGLMRVHMSNHECPECGPHGNRGRVALFDTEVACTTCAGGVPGDAFGRVAQDGIDDGPRVVLAIGDLVFDQEVKVTRGPGTVDWSKSGIFGDTMLINRSR